MKEVDKLFKMTSEELDDYLEQEVHKIIEDAPPEKRSVLRAIHNRARLQVQASKNPVDAMVRTNKLMAEHFSKLNESLKVFRS